MLSKIRLQNLQEFIISAILFCLPFYFIRLKHDWISFSIVEILIISLFILWILSKEEKYLVVNNKYSIPVALIITGLLLSTAVNKNYYTGLGVIKGWFLFPVLLAIIYRERLKKNEEFLGWSLKAFFWGGAFLSVLGIFYRAFDSLTYDGRLRIFYDSPNQLAMYLAPVFLVGIFLFYKEACKKHKLVYALGLVLISINLYFTFSFGAWVALVLALGASFWFSRNVIWKEGRKFIAIMAVLLVVISIFWAGFYKLGDIGPEGERSSLASRAMIWKSAGLMVKNSPFFGIGPGNFQEKYLEHQKYFPPYLEWAVPQPHNLFLAFWLEAGILGLVGFAWLLILFFRDNKKTRDNFPKTGLLCLAVMLYFLIHGLVDTTYWRNDMAVIFWAVIAANLFLAEKMVSEKNGDSR